MESNLNLLWTFRINESVPISTIYTDDIDGDGNSEILFRTKNGYLYCLNILGENLWKYTTISLSASNIIGSKSGQRISYKESKEVLYGTAQGEIVILDEKGTCIFKK